jgi:hypothetical protein
LGGGPVWVPGLKSKRVFLLNNKQQTNNKIRTQVQFVFYSSVILIRIKIRQIATVKKIKRTGSKCSNNKNPPGPRGVKVKEEITIRGLLFFCRGFVCFRCPKQLKQFVSLS